MAFCYRPKRSLEQGNVFTPVCHSVYRAGCMADTPWAVTPRQTPPRQSLLGKHPLGRHPLGSHSWANTPWADTLPPRWQLKQAVRILLKCILVELYVYQSTIRCMNSWQYLHYFKRTLNFTVVLKRINFE